VTAASTPHGHALQAPAKTGRLIAIPVGPTSTGARDRDAVARCCVGAGGAAKNKVPAKEIDNKTVFMGLHSATARAPDDENIRRRFTMYWARWTGREKLGTVQICDQHDPDLLYFDAYS